MLINKTCQNNSCIVLQMDHIDFIFVFIKDMISVSRARQLNRIWVLIQ